MNAGLHNISRKIADGMSRAAKTAKCPHPHFSLLLPTQNIYFSAATDKKVVFVYIFSVTKATILYFGK